MNANQQNVDRKKFKFKLKKPLLKSIILSTAKPTSISVKSEQENNCNSNSVSDINSRQENLATNLVEEQLIGNIHEEDEGTPFKMQKNNKHISLKSDDHRSYSPPLPKSSKIASIISSGSQNPSNTEKQSRISRERKSSKKKKRRRRSYSRSSHSRYEIDFGNLQLRIEIDLFFFL